MATLLAKLLPSDISQYIYYLALNDFLQNKINIYSYNMFLIFDKHLKIINNKNKEYNIPLLIITDLNKIISNLAFVKNNFINPYKKWNINFEKNYLKSIKHWSSEFLSFTKKYIEKIKSNISFEISLEYKLLLKQKYLIEMVDNLINNYNTIKK